MTIVIQGSESTAEVLQMRSAPQEVETTTWFGAPPCLPSILLDGLGRPGDPNWIDSLQGAFAQSASSRRCWKPDLDEPKGRACR